MAFLVIFLLGFLFLDSFTQAAIGPQEWQSHGCKTNAWKAPTKIDASTLSSERGTRCCGVNGGACRSFCTASATDDQLTFAEAEAFCLTKNMRLCSLAELEGGACCSTGCSLDTQWNWALEAAPAPATCSDGTQNGDEMGTDCGGSCAPCAGEFYIGIGGCRDVTPDMLPLNIATDTAGVRCCQGSGAATQCQTPKPCPGAQDQSFANAVAKCASLGESWRLCTVEEIKQDLCCSTGCGLDGSRVWTSTKQD